MWFYVLLLLLSLVVVVVVEGYHTEKIGNISLGVKKKLYEEN